MGRACIFGDLAHYDNLEETHGVVVGLGTRSQGHELESSQAT